eukprot:3181538-Pleurochrysis_carterae.AAC.4
MSLSSRAQASNAFSDPPLLMGSTGAGAGGNFTSVGGVAAQVVTSPRTRVFRQDWAFGHDCGVSSRLIGRFVKTGSVFAKTGTSSRPG